MKSSNNILTIGIGGVSRAGKTELANFLKEEFEKLHLKVALIQQDNYVFSKNKIPTINNRTDWESPSSINHKAYLTAIKDAKNNGYDIIIAEGLLTFYDNATVDFFDKKIFVEIQRTTFVKRKAADTRWGEEPDWYIDHIWKSYEKYGKTILDTNSNIFRILGENRSAYTNVWEYICPPKILNQDLVRKKTT